MSEVSRIASIIKESFHDTNLSNASEQGIFQEYDPMIPAFMDMIGGRNWTDFLLVLETSQYYWVQTYGEMLAYMTPKAFHYFAPAVLIFSMNENADVLPGSFFGQLYPHGPEPVQHYIQERIDQFSDTQKHAIAIVIHQYYSSNRDETQFAKDLQNYWAEWL